MPSLAAATVFQGLRIVLTPMGAGTPAGFTVGRHLGRGGMGSVFAALDDEGGQAAVKFMPVGDDDEFEARLHREHDRQATLHKQGVLVVPPLAFGFVEFAGQRWYAFAMMYLEGARPLGKDQTIARRVEELRMALEALVGFHRKEGVHRDLTPDNLLVAEDRLWIADLGLASARKAPKPGPASGPSPTAGYTAVLRGWGKTPYQAPEHWILDRPDAADLRSPKLDVYSMGVIAYELLFEQYPRPPRRTKDGDEFPHRDVTRFIDDRTRADPPRRFLPVDAFRDGEVERVDAAVWEAIRAALDLDAETRPADVKGLLDAVRLVERALRPLHANPLGEDLLKAADTAGATPPNLPAAPPPGEPNPDESRPEDDLRAVWEEEEARPRLDVADPSNPLGLWEWQKQAVEAWFSAGMRGYVEAVTGSGKSLVAYEVIRRHLLADAKNNAIVLVPPSLPLLRQWWGGGASPKGLALFLPEWPAGRAGDKAHGSLLDHRIVVTTDRSLANLVARSGRALGPHTLLVADECHHFSGVVWTQDRFGNERISPNVSAQAVIDLPCRSRLGLSATVEAFESMELSLGGGRVFQLTLARALELGYVSPFKVAFVRCGFGSPEVEAEHAAAVHKAGKLAQQLRAQFGAAGATPQGFWAGVGRESAVGNPAARAYLAVWQAARKLRARAEGKFAALAALAPAMKEAKRSLVFSNLREAGARAAAMLHDAGLVVAYIDGDDQQVLGEGRAARRSVILGRLEADTRVPGRVEVVVSPQVLDEGLDVPAAAMGVVIMGARGRRQMIQRLGRVLRRKEGKVAKFVILCIRDTSEDPDRADGSIGHEDFIREVLDVRAEDGSALLLRGKDWETFDAARMPECIAWLGGRSAPAPDQARPRNAPSPRVEPELQLVQPVLPLSAARPPARNPVAAAASRLPAGWRAPNTGTGWEKAVAQRMATEGSWYVNSKENPVFVLDGLNVLRLRVYNHHVVARIRARSRSGQESPLSRLLTAQGHDTELNADGWFTPEWRIDDRPSFEEFLDEFALEWGLGAGSGPTPTPVEPAERARAAGAGRGTPVDLDLHRRDRPARGSRAAWWDLMIDAVELAVVTGDLPAAVWTTQENGFAVLRTPVGPTGRSEVLLHVWAHQPPKAWLYTSPPGQTVGTTRSSYRDFYDIGKADVRKDLLRATVEMAAAWRDLP